MKYLYAMFFILLQTLLFPVFLLFVTASYFGRLFCETMSMIDNG